MTEESLYINPWLELPNTPPFVLSQDAGFLSEGLMATANLKLGVLPVPFIGDPRRASVLLLSLNPGWIPDTDVVEAPDSACGVANRACLRFEAKVPFFWIDDRLNGIPGHRYWTRRLRLLIERFGLHHIGRNVACVEWFPYHSPTFTKLPMTLPSQRYGFELVRQALARGAVVVLLRSRKLWVESVPALASSNVPEVRVPIAPFVTPANLGAAGFARVCNALESVR